MAIQESILCVVKDLLFRSRRTWAAVNSQAPKKKSCRPLLYNFALHQSQKLDALPCSACAPTSLSSARFEPALFSCQSGMFCPTALWMVKGLDDAFVSLSGGEWEVVDCANAALQVSFLIFFLVSSFHGVANRPCLCSAFSSWAFTPGTSGSAVHLLVSQHGALFQNFENTVFSFFWPRSSANSSNCAQEWFCLGFVWCESASRPSRNCQRLTPRLRRWLLLVHLKEGPRCHLRMQGGFIVGDNHLGISALDACPFPLQYALRHASGSGAPGCSPNIICSTSAVSFSMCPPRASNSVQAPGLAAFMLTLGATSLLQQHPRPQWVMIWPPASAVLLDAHIPLNPLYELPVLSRIGRSPSLHFAGLSHCWFHEVLPVGSSLT